MLIQKKAGEINGKLKQFETIETRPRSRGAPAFSLSSIRLNCYKTGMEPRLTVGFFGAGKMATALARGFIRAGLVRANQLIASDVSKAARDAFTEETGARTAGSNSEVAEFAKVLMLAVKPEQVVPVLSGIRNDF